MVGCHMKYYRITFELEIKQFLQRCYGPGSYLTYEVQAKDEDEVVHHFICDVCINGKNGCERKYISVMFRRCYTEISKPRRLTVNCMMSVKDIQGDMRFAQSFSFKTKIRKHHLKKNKTTKPFGFDKFVSIECLNENSAEFLHDDMLTLHIYILATHEYPLRVERLHPNFQLQMSIKNHLFDSKGENLNIYFNSPEFQLLSKYKYFQTIQNIPMKEAEIQYITVDATEIPAFKNLISFASKKTLNLPNLEQLLVLYIICDKYDIADLLDICITELKRNITTQNAWVVYNISDLCSDRKLKKFTAEYIHNHPVCIITEHDDFFDRFFQSRKMLIAFFDLNKPLRNLTSEITIYIINHNINHITSLEPLLEIYAMSKKLGIKDLLCKSVEKLKIYISKYNAYTILDTAVKCGDEQLATFASEYLYNHPETVKARYCTVFNEDDRVFEDWDDRNILNFNDFIPVVDIGQKCFL